MICTIKHDFDKDLPLLCIAPSDTWGRCWCWDWSSGKPKKGLSFSLFLYLHSISLIHHADLILGGGFCFFLCHWSLPLNFHNPEEKSQMTIFAFLMLGYLTNCPDCICPQEIFSSEFLFYFKPKYNLALLACSLLQAILVKKS